MTPRLLRERREQQYTPVKGTPEPTADGNLAPFAESVRHYAEQAKAANTKRAYASNWRDFEAWCRNAGVESLPATSATVGAYLADQAKAGKSVATLQMRIAAINKAHTLAGIDRPARMEFAAVGEVLRGIRRELGTAQKQKLPILTDHLQKLPEPKRLIEYRNRALLLVGFAGAFRRSELVALNVEDLEFSDQGVMVNVRRSKTDQEAKGRRVAIARGNGLCPVRALEEWLKRAEIAEGPAFRAVNKGGRVATDAMSTDAVADAVKQFARLTGMDVPQFSGHSLRAGHITQADICGVPEAVTMRQSGHKSRAVFDRYRRDADLWRRNSSASLGL